MSNDLLNIWSLNQCSKELNELDNHTLDAYGLIVFVRVLIDQWLARVHQDLSEHGQVTVQQLPCRPEYQINTLPRVIHEVPKDHRKAAQCLPLQLKVVFLRVDTRQEYTHPLIEGRIQTCADHLVVDSISPGNAAETQVEHM